MGGTTENFRVTHTSRSGREQLGLKPVRHGEGSLGELADAYELLSQDIKAAVPREVLFPAIEEAYEGIKDALESGGIILGTGRKIDQQDVARLLPSDAPIREEAEREGVVKTTVADFISRYGEIDDDTAPQKFPSELLGEDNPEGNFGVTPVEVFNALGETQYQKKRQQSVKSHTALYLLAPGLSQRIEEHPIYKGLYIPIPGQPKDEFPNFLPMAYLDEAFQKYTARVYKNYGITSSPIPPGIIEGIVYDEAFRQ